MILLILVGISSVWSLGMIIPLYNSPAVSAFSEIAEVAQQYPSVPILVIMHVSVYPNTSTEDTIKKLHAAGVRILAYVWTDFGNLGLANFSGYIQSMQQLHGIDGVFFDGAPIVSGYRDYYVGLSDFVHSLGMWPAVANPSQPLPIEYVGSMDIFCMLESYYVPAGYLTWFFPPDEVYIIAHNVSTLDQYWVDRAHFFIEWMYISDGGIYTDDYYDRLPTYFNTEVSAMAFWDFASSAERL